MNYTDKELQDLGIKFGNDVKIHRTALFFGNNVEIGSNIRIDCYSVITSGEPVVLGNHIHIAAGVHIFGSGGVRIHDYCGLSSRCSIYTATDDYSDGYLTGPTIPDEFKKITCAPVVLEKHVVVGTGSVIMPGVTLKQGVTVGAQSYVNKDVPDFLIVAGTPIRKIGRRNHNRLLELEKQFEAIKGTC
jgi:galactoside O-acetyltransferase